jgi:hypothetical protein
LPPAFAALAADMPPTVRRLLVDNGDPSVVAVDSLLNELCMPTVANARVVSKPTALSPHACAALRDAVDRERSERSGEQSVSHYASSDSVSHAHLSDHSS